VHGFFAAGDRALGRALWLLGLGAVGIVALSGWGIGAQLALSPRAARAVILAAWLQLAVYLSLLVSGRQSFLVAIVQYLPATLFLLWAIVWRARRAALPGAVPAALGLALMLAAAPVQQARIELLALGLTYNSVYHVVQGLGFALFFTGARRWVTAPAKTLEEVPC
jgi:hypothetical protein